LLVSRLALARNWLVLGILYANASKPVSNANSPALILGWTSGSLIDSHQPEAY
jgi:hypothetical protein